jgi:ABC-type molybdate transport system permease subunit
MQNTAEKTTHEIHTWPGKRQKMGILATCWLGFGVALGGFGAFVFVLGVCLKDVG